MKLRILFSFLLVSFFIQNVQAQDDLLGELESETEELTFQYPAFKAMKIANLQSTKVAAKGDLYMYVSHRFGSVKDGFDTFFGLDNANTKIQMVYGLLEGFQLGISRESLRKTYAGSAKLVLANQSDKFPLNLTGYATVNINTSVTETIFPDLKDADRFSYAYQLLMSRRLSNSISLEIAPTFVRENLVFNADQDHNQVALGIGGRFKVSKRSSINWDYVYNFNRADDSVYQNPLSIGMDIETGGHVFQLLFSNAQSTNEPGFISNAEGDWSDGVIFFGFNIVRVF